MLIYIRLSWRAVIYRALLRLIGTDEMKRNNDRNTLLLPGIYAGELIDNGEHILHCVPVTLPILYWIGKRIRFLCARNAFLPP